MKFIDDMFRLRDLKKLLSNWKFLSSRKILFLPHLLGTREKYVLGILLLLTLISGGILGARAYVGITKVEPQVGGSYVEGVLREPRNINPIYAVTDGDRDISNLVFSSLLTYSGKGLIKPDLAELYEISSDGKVYTVVLKKNAFWHDGKPVRADDVVFTIKTIQNPQYKSPLRANWQGVVAEKIDTHTVRFTLRSPYSPFLENLAVGIIPQHLWEAIGPEQAPLHELNLRPVGSGPYTFNKIDQKNDGSIVSYRLKRNSNYYSSGPYLKYITFEFYKTEEELLAAWHRGKIDGFGPFPAERVDEFAREKVNILKIGMPRLIGLFFNTQSSVLTNRKVRLAIAHAIDKNQIASTVALNGAAATDSILPVLAGTSGERFPYDPEASKKLLDEAGWKDADGDGRREQRKKEKGKEVITPLRLTLTTSDWPDLMQSASMIEASLKAIGFDVTVDKRSFTDLEANVIRPRNFDTLLFGQAYGYEADPFTFWHSSQIKDPGLNVSIYTNKRADALLEESRRTFDEELRMKKYQEVQKIIQDDVPAIFLYSQLFFYLIPRDMRGVEIKTISLPTDRFNEANLWYRETKRVLK